MTRFKWLGLIKRPRIYGPIAAIIVLIVIAFLVVRGLSAPAVGSISQTPPSQAPQPNPYSAPGFYSGKYISFRYPAGYKAVPVKLTGTYLETASYHAVDLSGWQINVGVSPGSISSDSGVAYRRLHKELYRETDSRLGAEFIKLDNTEDTYFIQHGSYLASVSATAPGAVQPGDAQFVASSLRWKQ